MLKRFLNSFRTICCLSYTYPSSRYFPRLYLSRAGMADAATSEIANSSTCDAKLIDVHHPPVEGNIELRDKEDDQDLPSSNLFRENLSRRMKRSRRKGLLHKRQLNEADGNTDAEAGKRLKVDDESTKMKESHNETDCYIENGLRKVYPYRYTYLCYCKARWKGKALIDVLNNEFMGGNAEFHVSQIENGFVKVNGKDVKTTYVLRGKNELISNITHRHELPVTAQPLKIISETEDYVVVDKPSSIPVHPCGRYRHNSVTFMLSREHGFHNLRTIYRLDRLTSGLLIFGRTHDATNHIMDSIKQRTVSKTYLCRVDGEFPDGTIECKEPLDKVHEKIGTWRVKKGGKDSHTSFEKVSYNGNSSVVKCYPHTGRTHQIRVHLQYLGHPIVNDPLYNDDVWGKDKGKNGEYGKSDNELYEDLVAMHNSKFFETDLMLPDETSLTPAQTDIRLTSDPNCDYCKKRYKDPHPDKLVMYLHSLSYKGPDWEFRTEEPAWAQTDWKSTSKNQLQ
ncbi:pseudouridylate synthase RPUSD2-like [Watersipora subatra]|uniref:pseudouridylate synthase RPUSD2-like n=1 Tax=Watersipora subatra TaxID=2589382 RepID=UPI00355B5627